MPKSLLVPDLAQTLTTHFLILQHFSSSRSILYSAHGRAIKTVADYQAKCTIVLELVLKRDQHDETKG